jgi:hypothetical protein
MNRNVLLVYLKNIRDLEVAKYQLSQKKSQAEAKYRVEIDTLNRQIAEETTPHYQDEPSSPTGAKIVSGVLAVLGGMVLWDGIQTGTLATNTFYTLVLAAVFLGPAWALYPRDAIAAQNKAQAHNAAERQRIAKSAAQVPHQKQTLQAKQNALDAYRNGCNAELIKIDRLLQNAYSLNILPSQHRNLASVYYIYDYMSTSQASLRDTLLHEHMENGIQRILNRLDAIMAQNEQHILLERRMEAHSRATVENTKQMLYKQQRMLESMERTEQNIWEATQAARIAAQYGEINLFFDSATFLVR